MHGFLVMWMAAGFCMLEAGLARSKNTTMQCLKNIALYAVSGIAYWVVGNNCRSNGVDGGWIGAPGPWGAADPAVMGDGFKANDVNVYAAGSDWFFQMVFVVAVGPIVSGTVAERVKVFSFLIFAVVLIGIIYPIQGAWTWGGGCLSEVDFLDFAGSTVVHSVGGRAALAGAIIIGARKGKFSADGRVTPMLDKLKIDDVVGAIPVHLVCGIWGTIAVVFSNGDAKIDIQILGILAVGAFVFFATSIAWLVIKMTISARPSDEDEALGLDRAECGYRGLPGIQPLITDAASKSGH